MLLLVISRTQRGSVANRVLLGLAVVHANRRKAQFRAVCAVELAIKTRTLGLEYTDRVLRLHCVDHCSRNERKYQSRIGQRIYDLVYLLGNNGCHIHA